MCSESLLRDGVGSRRFGATIGLWLAALLPAQAPSEAELVALAFPRAVVVRCERSLTPTQSQAVAERAGAKVAGVVVCHTATVDGKVVGFAYLDTRTVRTHGQSLLVCLDAAGKVLRVEVLAFAEPRQYQPRGEFFAQFVGKGLDDTLRLRRGIRNVAGATLSAVAAVDAVRVVLALHAELGAGK